ncbi:uncharacterized protein [Gossypium hirsutum]|uniref:Retrotransposon gag domain-containing protein n=1 Tax=Gossypium hirsutum TaxID=3635 RepID=A0ABM2YMX7_GOSHI|nr:uncharacterized protein LOC121205015 [Gossypium hirsutum]
MSDRPERTEQEEANSRVQTPEQGTSSDIPISMMRERELRNMIYGVMNQWYKEMIQERSQSQPPPPPTAPPMVPPVAPPPPSIIETSKRSPIEKLRKFGAEEFRGRSDDDPIKAEYWLQSLVRIFKQMTCSPEDYLRCAVSLLKEEAYNWWETMEAVVPAEKLTWEFFQNEFKKKYVGKRYLGKKKREFLDPWQRNKSVAEYKREFVYLSKYARDIVPTEEEMYRVQKLEEVYNRKIQRDRKNKESFKRGASKSFSDLPVKKSRVEISRTTSVPGRLGRGRSRQSDFKVFDRPTASVSSVQNTPRLKCQYCGRHHFGECRTKMGAFINVGLLIILFEIAPSCKKMKWIRNRYREPLPKEVDVRARAVLQGLPVRLKQLPIVNEFTDVFPEELLGLPPDREVEFVIDVIPGTASISKNVEFVWSEKCQQSFDQLKKMLTEALVLTQPESGKANVVADALSRKSSLFALRAMNVYLSVNENGLVLAELKEKSTFLQRIREL